MAVEMCRRRFSVDDYHRMVGAGILCESERVELIRGEVVPMTPIGPRHNGCVNRASAAFASAVAKKAIVQTQGSVRLSFFDEPEPDLVLLRPKADFYISAHPHPADILLIVEIADSTLAYDSRIKARLYAESGVPEYWLADVAAGIVARYTDPVDGGYRDVHTFRRGAMIAPALLPDVRIAVEDLVGD